MKHTLPLLPYSEDAFGSRFSKETFEFHHGKHHQAYVNNLNRLIEGTEFEDMPLEEIVKRAEGVVYNNAAQAWNHEFYFGGLTPERVEMPEVLERRLNEAFGSVEGFKAEFVKAATGLFGSGWAWLVEDKEGTLSIVQTSNAGSPMVDGLKPLMTVDVWEHAYYIDYRNDRKSYVEACLECIDWGIVAERL